MNTRVDEITSGIYRVSVYIPEADFMFNQFLVDGDEPLLFHTGPRRLFPIVSRLFSMKRGWPGPRHDLQPDPLNGPGASRSVATKQRIGGDGM